MGTLVQALSQQLNTQTIYANTNHNKAQVDDFLKAQHDSQYIKEGQELYNGIISQNAANQAAQRQANINAMNQ